MAKRIPDINAAKELHRLGNRNEAKVAYLAILRQIPKHTEALHALGILYTQEENFQKAAEYLEKAMNLAKGDPSIPSHLANVYKFQGLFLKATNLLEKTIVTFPDYIPLYNNLGTVYYEQGKFIDAIRWYRKAIEKKPDYMDAYYNLGLALARNHLLLDAIDIYKIILSKVPDHFAARFHLACVYMQTNKISDAIQEFLIIEKTHAHHFETETNLATCYLKEGKLDEAKIHYLKALELRSEDMQILYNLGVISMQQGIVDAAIQYYQRVLKKNPDLFACQNNIAVAFLARSRQDYALQHFKEAKRLEPENKSIAYMVESLSQNQTIPYAPSAYIQSLFDAYADHYEPHLLKALEYKIPTLFLEALKYHISSGLHILDLGCGTGLCGEVFKPYAKMLTGVDLSEKMLDVAKQKNIYDSLTASDISTFLQDKIEKYDLIVSGDVFVYTGDLAPLFQKIRAALTKNGLFIFNTEICDDIDYKMNQSGRFSHQKSYLETLTSENNFKVISEKTCVTRMQNNVPVKGYLFVLKCR